MIKLAFLLVWALEFFVTFSVTIIACGDAWWARLVGFVLVPVVSASGLVTCCPMEDSMVSVFLLFADGGGGG